jgi:hypothetical protein
MIGAGHRRALALVVAATLGLAGCLTDAPTPSVVPTATPEPEATPTVTTYELDTTVWYAGLILTFGTATATIDAKGGRVDVDLTLDNPGSELGTLAGPIRLTSGGRGLEPSRDSDIPDVPAGEVATTSVAFDVDRAFDVPGAAIRVGRSEEHQAVVALVRGAVEDTTLEPQRFELTGSTQAGSLLVAVHSAEIRADLPDWSLQLPRAIVALTLTYDVTFRGDFSGGFAFTTENLGLLLPDGTTIAARADGRSAPAVVIGPNQVLTGLTSRFEVPAPGIGLYKLIVRDGAATTQLELAIAGA